MSLNTRSSTRSWNMAWLLLFNNWLRGMVCRRVAIAFPMRWIVGVFCRGFGSWLKWDTMAFENIIDLLGQLVQIWVKMLGEWKSLALARIIQIRHCFHLSHLCSHVLKMFEPFIARNMKSTSIHQEVTVIIIAVVCVGGGRELILMPIPMPTWTQTLQRRQEEKRQHNETAIANWQRRMNNSRGNG